MDPDACLRRWRNACNNNDRDEMRAAWWDLYDWLARGGIPPAWGGVEAQMAFFRFRCRRPR